MTVAVCFSCGNFKHGAWTPCSRCGNTPRTEDEMVVSLAATDHHLSMDNLKKISATVEGGEPIKVDPASHQMLLNQIRESGVARMLGLNHPDRTLAQTKPWWKFW